MSNQIRKIRRNIIEIATGSRSFKNRVKPEIVDTRRKILYRKISEFGKQMKG